MACAKYPGVHQIVVARNRNEILTDDPGVVGDGGNSGFQALNLAVQFGAQKIILVGFDMRLDRGTHWHGRHPPGLNNPNEHNMVKWRKVLDGSAAHLQALGVTVINASPLSALTAYPKMTFAEALAC
jgi:hypothetical protein